MSMSGATITEECLKDYMALKMDKKVRYDYQLIELVKPEYKHLETNRLQEHDESLSNRESFEKMKTTLEQDKPLFIVFTFKYTNQDGANAGKLAFISWIPDDCSVKQRMVNAACKVYLKNKLEGVAEDGIHATSLSDLDYDEILTTVSKRKAKLN